MHGIDYTETFSPVVKAQTVRIVLSLALHSRWQLRQLDVSNAFLHGKLEEEVFMAQPQGFVDSLLPHHVCRLNKAIYGLKQAPRAWYHLLSQFLLTCGFQCSKADTSLFVCSTPGVLLVVLVYVDDIIITGSSSETVSQLISQMQSRFDMKDLGELSYFLGIEVHRWSKGMLLQQSKYASDIIARAGMTDCKSSPTPALTHFSTSSTDHDPPYADPTLFRSLTGALQYLTVTRPDIQFAVNSICQHMHHPRQSHFAALKRILRYIQGTIHRGLFFRPSSLVLNVYSDSDWASDKEDRKSTTGYCVFLGDNLISWTSKKQSTVARSSTEAEYRAMASAATETLWLTYILRDLHIPVQVPTLWSDSSSALQLASNPVFHHRTKHIEIDYHFVRDQVVKKRLNIGYLQSQDQLADILTKSLGTTQFDYLIRKLPLRQAAAQLEGG